MPNFTNIQSGGTGNGGSGQASVSHQLTGVQAGSLIRVWAKHEGAAVNISVSDGTSSFTPATKRSNGSNTHGQWFYLLASVASGTVTYVASFDGVGGDFPSIIVYESGYSGGAPVFDAENGATGNSAAVATGNIATTGDVSLVGVGYAEFVASFPTAEQINGITPEVIQDVTTANFTSAWSHRFAAKINGQGTATITSSQWAAAIIAFKIPDPVTGASKSGIDDDGDDFLTELRGQWFSPDLIIEKWFDEDLEPAAAGGNDLVAAGSLSISGAADLDATGSLLAAGALSIAGAADLDAAGSLAAAGAVSISGAADLDAIGQLLAAGSIFINGTADLTSAAADDLAATGSLSIAGSADLDAIGNLLAAGALEITGLAGLTDAGDNDLEAVGSLVIAGSASLASVGALIAAGSIVITGGAGGADLTDGNAAPGGGDSAWLVLARRRGRR